MPMETADRLLEFGDSGTKNVSGTMQAFGASVAWMRDNLCHEELARSKAEGVSRHTYINENSLKSPLGSNGLFLPHFAGGERAPHWDAHAKGAFVSDHETHG